MSGVEIIQAVDDTLKKIATDAVASLTPKPDIVVGPLDTDRDDFRINWFLYRIGPNLAYRNMEPPRTGLRSARGNPPLAIELHYLLTSFPAKPPTGDAEQFAHVAFAAVMRALHGKGIVGEGDAALAAHSTTTLVEPLRITMDILDLESLSKIWTAATQPIRLSAGYIVSLVVVDSARTSVVGPPVQERVVEVIPSVGPRFVSVTPERARFGVDLTAIATGLTSETIFTLARMPGDPAGVEPWPMTVVSATGDEVVLRLPRADLMPGNRRLDAIEQRGLLAVARDSEGISIVPATTGPSTQVTRGTAIALSTVHAGPDVEVFLGGDLILPAQTTYVSATSVGITVPPTTPLGPTAVMLRSNGVAGPEFTLLVGP